MRCFLAIKKVRKLMFLYPDLILIKVKSVYERDSEYINNDNKNNYAENKYYYICNDDDILYLPV